MENKTFFQRLISRVIDFNDVDKSVVNKTEEPLKNINNQEDNYIKGLETHKPLPPGRVSRPEYENNFSESLTDVDFVTPDFVLETIPYIRKLSKVNEDLGSVYNDLIQLTNTGHNIKFDQTITTEEVARMRKHLKEVSRNWGSGVSGIDGLVNKMVGQVWISGALSNEWVPKKTLDGIQNNVLVNPENIKFKYNKAESKYEPYQKVKNLIADVRGNNLIKLNPETYHYFGMLGDTDSPYGIPPFITALEALSTQRDMKNNIKHIMKQLGLLGYLEVTIDKPSKLGGEGNSSYIHRLENLLRDTKRNLMEGFMDGIVIGYEGDHTFQFHSTSKNLSGVSDIFNQNETQVANGLKTSPTFIGQKGTGTENNMSIVFTKMLSQLSNVQRMISANLERGYYLELRLAGFNIKSHQLSVVFKTSTISDDLKLWQAKEIKQRVLHKLAVDGIIDQDQYAEEMTYDRPAKSSPIVPYEDQEGKGGNNQEAKDKREKDKDTSDRRNRDKNKPQPKRKDTNTKPQ